jgi:pimeloyl-ACP methyl ester carboxylesterase
VLAFMGFLGHVEPFELQRFSLLAHVWDAQITVLDVPGCGYGSARLRRHERVGLRRGDFAPVAHRMAEAAVAAHPRLAESSVIVAGYSLGASLAAAAATGTRLDVRDVTLVEPVAIRRWHVAELVYRSRSEDRVLDEYLDRNERVSGAVAPRVRRGDTAPRTSWIDLGHLGFALTRGQIGTDLVRGHRRHGFGVQLIHGKRSHLSRADDVEQLASTCRSAGIAVHDLPVLGRHALWHSLPDVADLAHASMARWAR